MSGKKTYRVAVAGGAGAWGRKYLHAYANHPQCEIVALVDLARAALARATETRQRESMHIRNLRDHHGEALQTQKRQSVARRETQRKGSANSPYRKVTMAQRRQLNRR